MKTDEKRPRGALAESLLSAARDEAPSEAATERALALVDASSAPPKPRVGWALLAAALVVGLSLLLWLRPATDGESAVAEPLPTMVRETVSGSPPAIAAPTPAADATSEPVASASAQPSAVAQRPMPVGPSPAPPSPVPPKAATSARPPSVAGCPPNDLMCNLRQSQKKKKKKK